MSAPLTFAPFAIRPPGTLAALLAESYAPLLAELPPEGAAALRCGWQEFDREAHLHAETVGRCGFLTFVGDELAGFGSWDPRGRPEIARIGHHCVRPAWQGRGCGQRQLQEILARLRARGFAAAEARTGAQPFFAPARRLYERCGFTLIRPAAATLGAEQGTLIYRVELEGRA